MMNTVPTTKMTGSTGLISSQPQRMRRATTTKVIAHPKTRPGQERGLLSTY